MVKTLLVSMLVSSPFVIVAAQPQESALQKLAKEQDVTLSINGGIRAGDVRHAREGSRHHRDRETD